VLPTLRKWVCILVYEVLLLDSSRVGTNLWDALWEVLRVIGPLLRRFRDQWRRDRCTVTRNHDYFWIQGGRLQRRGTKLQGGKISRDIVKSILVLRIEVLMVRWVRWGEYERVECRIVGLLWWWILFAVPLELCILLCSRSFVGTLLSVSGQQDHTFPEQTNWGQTFINETLRGEILEFQTI